MPFTPFHFGPGLLLKSVAPRHISVAAYAAANVVVDVEPLYHLLRGEPRLHGWTHRFIGAAGLGALAGLACAALTRTVVPRGVSQPDVLRGETSFVAIMTGAILGGITHPFFDGLMHGDLRPFLPFSEANPLLHLVPHGMVAPFCASAGLIGAAILWLRRAAWKVAG